MIPIPSSPAAMGMNKTAGITKNPHAARWESPELVAEEAMIHLQVRVERVLHLPTVAGKAPPADSRLDQDPDRKTWTLTTTWDSAQALAHSTSGMDPRAGDPLMADRLEYPQAEDHLEECREGDPLEIAQAEGPQTEEPLEDHQAETSLTNRREWTSPRTSCDGL